MEQERDLDVAVPPGRCRGRGAGLALPGRFERLRRGQDDELRDPEPPDLPLATEVTLDRSRSILARNRSPDLPFDRSVNPYRGCEHGCVYCYARPGHSELGLSPGLDFETRLIAKPRAPALLRAALARPGYVPAVLAIGTMTDAYQPLEGRMAIMRGVLEVLRAFRHPVSITTKGALVTRDLDILGPMGRAGLAAVQISLTTLDNRLSRSLEPRAAAPGRRIAAIRALANAGVPVTANIAPIIPGLTDPEIERLVAAAAEAGAIRVWWSVLRLPREVATLFQDWLARVRPGEARKIMNRVRQVHGGQDYDPTWFRRMKGQGVHADLIRRRVEIAARRHGLDRPAPALRTDLFAVPEEPGQQLALAL